MLSFDVRIDLVLIKYNRYALHDDVLGDKVILFIFSHVYKITFQNTSRQKVASLVFESRSDYFRTSFATHFWSAAMILLSRNHAEAVPGNILWNMYYTT